MKLIGGLQRPLFRPHPFGGYRVLNTQTARERDGWVDSATTFSKNEDFWRNRTKERCARDGHVWVRCDDGSANYCTCCGAME